jgi:hypothetical protein
MNIVHEVEALKQAVADLQELVEALRRLIRDAASAAGGPIE